MQNCMTFITFKLIHVKRYVDVVQLVLITDISKIVKYKLLNFKKATKL